MSKNSKDKAEEENFSDGLIPELNPEFSSKWRDSPSEELAASQKTEPQYIQEYLRADVWFNFFDPYKSLIGTAKPKFVNFDGTSLIFQREVDAQRLLDLAIEAANEYLNARSPVDLISDDAWNESLMMAKQLVRGLRNSIPFERITFVDWQGVPVEKIDPNEVDALALGKIYCEVLSNPTVRKRGREIERRECRQMLCLLSLREIDTALMYLNHPRNESISIGLKSAIEATVALVRAYSLRPEGAAEAERPKTKITLSNRAEISAYALEVRNARRYAAQDWAWNEWLRIGESQYGNNKSEFARDFVVPKVRTIFETAAGKPLEVGQKQVVEVWLKAPRAGRSTS
ncbi:MAG: hypothetical protein Q7K57_44775 [Burkholderiaceae bacterium]|nr:hypothetical protein [Burkholderiaceae bacterium]